jgi:hypothetical protein
MNITVDSQWDEWRAEKAARLVRKENLQTVRRGVLTTPKTLWSRYKVRLIARWGEEYLVLRSDGILFMCSGVLAYEVNTSYKNLLVLFGLHERRLAA